jgi:heat shock protein 5
MKNSIILLSIVCLIFTSVHCEEEKKEKTNKVECPVIGIDLGTTYSCVGIYRNGRVEIIPNELGNRITPSVVGFTDEERLTGEAAKNQATVFPARTVYDVKRLVGRKYSDKSVQNDKKYLPYDIINKDTKPYIKVDL